MLREFHSKTPHEAVRQTPMRSEANETTPPISAWRSPWLLGSVAMILVVLVVNATMVYLAVVTDPGLVNADYYARGQAYERSMASRLARNPGWTMQLDIPPDVLANEPTRVRFVVVDQVGQPVAPARVDFYAYRPADASKDFTATMAEEDRGRYVAEVVFPLIGIWDTLVAVSYGTDEHLIGERIQVGRP